MASFNAKKGLDFKECKPFFVPDGESVALVCRGHDCVIQIVRSSYKVSPDWLDQTIGNNRVLKIQNGGR